MFEAMRAVRDLRGVSAVKKAVLFVLVMRADETGTCWPSYRRIAGDAGVKIRTVIATIARLAEDGHVAVVHRTETGSREPTSNLYRIQVVHQMHDVVREDHQVVHLDHDPVNEMHGGGDLDARQVVIDVHGGSDLPALKDPIEDPIGRPQRREEPALRLAPSPPVREGKRKKTEKPPPSGTPELEVRAWLQARQLPVEHPQLAAFLDVYRNAKPKSDWPACWRNFLRSENDGKFAKPARQHFANWRARPDSFEGNPNPVTSPRPKVTEADLVAHGRLRTALLPPSPVPKVKAIVTSEPDPMANGAAKRSDLTSGDRETNLRKSREALDALNKIGGLQ